MTTAHEDSRAYSPRAISGQRVYRPRAIRWCAAVVCRGAESAIATIRTYLNNNGKAGA